MRRRDGGFTLLEVLIALALVGLLLGITVGGMRVALALGLIAPAIGRSTEVVRARATVAAFSAALRHAREQAITARERRTVVVDVTGRRLTIRTADDTIAVARTLPPQLTVEALAPTGLAVRFEPYGTSSGGAFRLTSGGVRYRVTVDALTGRVRNTRE